MSTKQSQPTTQQRDEYNRIRQNNEPWSVVIGWSRYPMKDEGNNFQFYCKFLINKSITLKLKSFLFLSTFHVLKFEHSSGEKVDLKYPKYNYYYFK